METGWTGTGKAVLLGAILTLLPEGGGASCVEYERVINGSGHRLRTCPLDHPPSYVYCCVDTCCEEPHLAILLTSIIGGVVISIIGIGLIVLCIIDVHRVTCQNNHDLESPLISDEEDDFMEDPKGGTGKWCTIHKVMGVPPGGNSLHQSRDPTPEEESSLALESTMTSTTQVTSLAATPIESIDLTEDENDEKV